MKKSLIIILFELLVVSAANAVVFDHATSLIDIPTASLMEHGDFEAGLSVDYYRELGPDNQGFYWEAEEDAWGAIGFFNLLQVGGTLYSFGGGYIIFGANLKLGLVREQGFWPSIAVGIDDIISHEKTAVMGYPYEKDMTDSVYAVFSKQLHIFSGMPVWVNIGIGNRVFRSEAEFFRGLYGIFAGIEARPFDDWSLIAEEDGRNINVGVKYRGPLGLSLVAFGRHLLEGGDVLNEGRRAVRVGVSFSNALIKKRVGELAEELETVKAQLAALNRGETPPELRTVFHAPEVKVEIPAEKQEKLTRYTVQKGDTLPKIAAKSEIYSDPKMWRRIYDANKDTLNDPYTLFVGQTLVVPRD